MAYHVIEDLPGGPGVTIRSLLSSATLVGSCHALPPSPIHGVGLRARDCMGPGSASPAVRQSHHGTAARIPALDAAPDTLKALGRGIALRHAVVPPIMDTPKVRFLGVASRKSGAPVFALTEGRCHRRSTTVQFRRAR